MKLMMKANKQLRVEDTRVDGLKELGYREVNPKTGEYLEQDEPEDKRKDSAVKKENVELKKQNAELTAKLADAEKALAESRAIKLTVAESALVTT